MTNTDTKSRAGRHTPDDHIFLRTAILRIKKLLRLIVPLAIHRKAYDLLSRRYASHLARPQRADVPTFLVIDHFFGQDIRALRNGAEGYNLIVVDYGRYFRSNHLYFSREVLTLSVPYESVDPAVLKAYRRFCRKLLNATIRRFPIDAILTPSDSYIGIREFIMAARERNIPTFVIDKEGTMSPYSFDFHAKRIRNMVPFISDHVFVWSDRQREFWQRIGVTQEKISVIGQPRSDLFFSENPTRTDALFPKVQPLVSCFTYHDTAYIPPERTAEGYHWKRMKKETLDILMDLADVFTGYNFVIKAHPQQVDLLDMQKLYRRPNLRVVGGSEIGNELIQRSELIIGFQTTAIIEAMFLQKRVIYTSWDPNCRPPLRDDLLPFHEIQGIVQAETAERFRDVVKRALGGDLSDFEFSPQELAAREDFVAHYLHQPDGHTCQRLFEAAGRLLNEKAV